MVNGLHKEASDTVCITLSMKAFISDCKHKDCLHVQPSRAMHHSIESMNEWFDPHAISISLTLINLCWH